jgi:hypothetical protein
VFAVASWVSAASEAAVGVAVRPLIPYLLPLLPLLHLMDRSHNHPQSIHPPPGEDPVFLAVQQWPSLPVMFKINKHEKCIRKRLMDG